MLEGIWLKRREVSVPNCNSHLQRQLAALVYECSEIGEKQIVSVSLGNELEVAQTKIYI